MSEVKRPVIEIQLSLLEKILQAVSFAGIIGIVTILFTYWSKVPDKVPNHFGVEGRPDDWSGKGSLLIIPITAIVFYAMLTLLERYPHIYNYAVEITRDNAEYQYKNARTMIEWIKAVLICMFAYIEWTMVSVALGRSQGMGMAVLLYILLMFVIIGYYIFRMVKPH